MDSSKTLHELCDMLGVSRRAVQGYEKAGLVVPTGRNKYGHLLYDESAQQRVAQIRLYQQLGFRVKEIKVLMEVSDEVFRSTIEQQIIRLKEEREKIDGLIRIAGEMIGTPG